MSMHSRRSAGHRGPAVPRPVSSVSGENCAHVLFNSNRLCTLYRASLTNVDQVSAVHPARIHNSLYSSLHSLFAYIFTLSGNQRKGLMGWQLLKCAYYCTLSPSVHQCYNVQNFNLSFVHLTNAEQNRIALGSQRPFHWYFNSVLEEGVREFASHNFTVLHVCDVILNDITQLASAGGAVVCC